MGSVSIVHWLLILIIAFVTVWPVYRILQKAGFSGWWSIIALIPLLNVIGVYVLAIVRWPVEDRARST